MGEGVVVAAGAAISVFVAALVGFQAVVAIREWRLRRQALGALQGGTMTVAGPDGASLVRVGGGEGGLLRSLARRIPQVWDLQHLLVQSGLDWTLEQFAARVVAFATVFGVVAVVASDSAPVIFFAVLFGALAPYLHVRRKKKKRMMRLEALLPDAIDSLARAVRAGHPLSESLRMVSEETPEPLARELQVLVEEQRFGPPFEDALMSFGDRVAIMDVRILITAIMVQKEVGGNLTEILEQIAETMRARFNLRRQVRIYTAQGRMSGYTLAILPVLVGAIISLINPGYLNTLFFDPIGQALLAGGIFLQCIGLLWIRQIVSIRF